MPASDRAIAEQATVAPFRQAEPGPWTPDAVERDTRPFAAMLVEGILIREVMIGHRGTTHLLGPGDVFNPWPSHDVLASRIEWRVAERATVALLDERFLKATTRWPQLAAAITARLAEQADRMALHCAITALPRVDDRVLALFWHLAERWGRVTAEGVTVPMRLTHDGIGRLIGAQRPTVSIAVKSLEGSGRLTRLERGRWRLAPGSHAVLSPAPARKAAA